MLFTAGSSGFCLARLVLADHMALGLAVFTRFQVAWNCGAGLSVALRWYLKYITAFVRAG